MPHNQGGTASRYRPCHHRAQRAHRRRAMRAIRHQGLRGNQGTCGMPQVARAMLRGGVVGIAESRFENIRRLRDSGIDCPSCCCAARRSSRVEEVVRTVDISLQSELAVIRELSRVAERMGRVHDIILMIDLGDLREGIWPTSCFPPSRRSSSFRASASPGWAPISPASAPSFRPRKISASSSPMPARSSGDRLEPRLMSGGNSSLAAAAAVGQDAGRHQQSAHRRSDPAGWA